MPPLASSSRALARLAQRRASVLGGRSALGLVKRCMQDGRKLERFHQAQGFSCFADRLVDAGKKLGSSFGSSCNSMQTRWFLGCGDGEEGNFLSKMHEERRVIGYSPEQLFAVVAAVDLYEDFLPWCQQSRIIKRHNDGSFDAELEIGFKFFVESYVSHVEMNKPNYIKTTVSHSNLFDHLINIWEFKPGPVPGSCDLYFLVDFKFQSPLYSQIASIFFKEVVFRLVGSFTDRCRRIYGPGIRVLENSYGQGKSA